MKLRFRNDLNKRHSYTVEVEPLNLVCLSQRLCRILLELNLFDSDRDTFAILRRDSVAGKKSDVTVLGKWLIILGDLISRGLIPPEVMLSVESTNLLDFAVEGESCTESGDQSLFLKERLTARHGNVKKSDMAVWLVVERGNSR